MAAYYNENNAACVDWLRALIQAGHIPRGVVDPRPIQEVQPEDLREFTHCHFFAGIGEVGPTQLGLLDGLTSGPSGPVVVRVSRSHLLGKSSAKTIQGTYGPTSFHSSVPAGPLSSWESRLRQRMAMSGSTEWDLTWRVKTTPGGRVISRLAASTRRRSGTACTGWPAPKAHEAGPDFAKRERSGTGMALPALAAEIAGWQALGTDSFRTRSGDRKDELGLDRQAKQMAEIAGWAAPVVPNGGRRPEVGAMSMTGQTPDGKKRQVDLDYQARMITGLAGPTNRDYRYPNAKSYSERGGGKKGEQLPNQVAQLVGWPTARAEDGESCGNHPEAMDSLTGVTRVLGMTTNSSDQTPKGSIGALNPAFACWLQGYPVEWLSCVDWATASSRRRRPK